MIIMLYLLSGTTRDERLMAARILSYLGYHETEMCSNEQHTSCNGAVTTVNGVVTDHCVCYCHLTPEHMQQVKEVYSANPQ